MSAFIFHPAAAADLDAIVRYTRREWGEAQARAYAAKLKQCAQRCASGKADMVRHRQAGLGLLRCKRHIIAVLQREREPLLILAILHQRMDSDRHLAQRWKAIGGAP